MCLHRYRNKIRADPLERMMKIPVLHLGMCTMCLRERSRGSTEHHTCPIALIQPLQTKELVQHDATST